MTSSLLMNIALSEEQSLDVNVDACKRMRHRQNQCQRCSTICPEQAINLELGPTINNNCTQCGLCINACPTEVFQNKIDMEQYWLEKIQGQIGKNKVSEPNKILAFHCQQAQPQDNNSLAINCVGLISENLLLMCSLNAFRKIVIYTGECGDCKLSRGLLQFNECFNRAQHIIQLVDSKKFSVQQLCRPKKTSSERKLSRRAFFSSISKEVKDKALPADYYRKNPLQALLGYQETSAGIKHEKSRQRENLRKLLLAAPKRVNEKSNKLTIDFWKKMSVEQEKCVACAVCVNVCPTGALEKTVKDNYLYRYFRSALCSNCGLCQEACPQDIIRFSKNYTLQDIVEDKPQLVAQVKLTGCQVCGETIPVIEGEICTTCQKRQISPMFLS